MAYTEANLPDVLRLAFQKSGTSTTTQGDVTQSKAGPEGAFGEFFDAVSATEAVELYTVIRELRPQHTAEIGFCCGGSGMAILQGLRDSSGGTHHACDPFQTSFAGNRGRRNVERAGFTPMLDFHERFPEEVFPSLPQLQFVFIDASHLFDLSILDFVLADKKLDVGGIVAFHDLWMPSLQKLYRYIISNRPYEPYWPGGNGKPVMDARLRPKVRRRLGKLLSVLPKADQLFAPELLEDWSSFGVGNVAFLRKTANDARDFRHHVTF